MKTSRIVVSLILAVVVVSSANAGPINEKQVAGDAKWVVHMDVEALADSEIGDFIIGELQTGDKAGKIQEFAEKFGFDPLKDLKSITLYGSRYGPENGVALVKLSVEKEKILALIEKNEGHKETKHGDYVIHQWADKDGVAKFGSFYRDDLIVATQDIDLLKDAIAVLDGKKDNLADSEGLDILPSPAKGTFFLLAAKGFGELGGEGARKHPNMVKRLDACSYEVGEADGEVFLKAVIVAKDAEMADNVRKITMAIIAFAEMHKAAAEEADDSPFQGLLALLQSVKVSGQGNTVKIDASCDADDLTSILKSLIARKHRRDG